MNLIPNFLYGTAWKEGATCKLVKLALQRGFRGIDTANQRRHYFEEAVGLGLKEAAKALNIKRENLFLQTKFTYLSGQDHRLPYKPTDSFDQQVLSSFESSLEHLQTNYLDSLILHGPFSQQGISEEDKLVWLTMESLVNEKKVRFIGVSNINLEQLKILCNTATIKPAFVQNRCFAQLKWDKEIRQYCQENDIIYQGFSLLTANQLELAHPNILQLAKQHHKTIPQLVFRFSQQSGILPLTGTTNIEHMKDDLSIDDFKLNDGELSLIENIADQ